MLCFRIFYLRGVEKSNKSLWKHKNLQKESKRIYFDGERNFGIGPKNRSFYLHHRCSLHLFLARSMPNCWTFAATKGLETMKMGCCFTEKCFQRFLGIKSKLNVWHYYCLYFRLDRKLRLSYLLSTENQIMARCGCPAGNGRHPLLPLSHKSTLQQTKLD